MLSVKASTDLLDRGAWRIFWRNKYEPTKFKYIEQVRILALE
jgi:hypothetical protein